MHAARRDALGHAARRKLGAVPYRGGPRDAGATPTRSRCRRPILQKATVPWPQRASSRTPACKRLGAPAVCWTL
eukprot:365067-Chlamydomonas_euryale.AAC.8